MSEVTQSPIDAYADFIGFRLSFTKLKKMEMRRDLSQPDG